MRKRLKRRLCLALLVAAAIWLFIGETGVFYICSLWWEWPNVQAPLTTEHHDKTLAPATLKLLLFSDPHIQCTFNRYESLILRWDADRYLRNGVSMVMETMRPDMVVVLGDIFAEGYKASAKEWLDYLQCTKAVFQIPAGVKFVVVPGDNDIGGEGRDAMIEEVNRHYVSQFGEMNQAFVYNGVTFVKINTVTQIHSRPANVIESKARNALASFLKEYSINSSQSRTKTTIVLSHIPFKEIPDTLLRTKILESIIPDYVFSGHIHHTDDVKHTFSLADGAIRTAQEFTVPTCSYRMGEMYMGVGAASVGEDGHLVYTVLWLPQRYPFLISYGILSSILLVILLFMAISR